MVRTFKIYSHSNFQVYNTVFLTTITMLHIRSPDFILLVPGSFYSLTNISLFPPLPSPWQPPVCSLCLSSFLFCFFLDSTYKWSHRVFIFLCLAYRISVMLSRFIHVFSNGTFLQISFFFICEYYRIIYIHTHIAISLAIHLLMDK